MEYQNNRMRLLAVEQILLKNEGKWMTTGQIKSALLSEYNIYVGVTLTLREDLEALGHFYKIDTVEVTDRRFEYRLTRCDT
jgi:hypothetical protein